MSFTLVLWFTGQTPIILPNFSALEADCREALASTKSKHPDASVSYEDCLPSETLSRPVHHHHVYHHHAYQHRRPAAPKPQTYGLGQ